MATVPVLPQSEVIRQVAQNRRSFAAWIGAGCSAEAGIKTGRQICEDIREELSKYQKSSDTDDWANRVLSWNDPRRRYSTCLKKRAPTLDQRVEYFRTLLKDRAPAFSHHALSLLMTTRVLKRTCFTTNFDKLIEVAFAQQGFTEFQVIRDDSETPFWRGDDYDKSFILKLHGDYDAFNIKNTLDETIRIPAGIAGVARSSLRSSGLIVIGASGFEDSVIRFFNDLVDVDPKERTLSLGLYWAINVAPDDDTEDEAVVEAVVRQKLISQSISHQIQEVFERAEKSGINCGFFPVAGAGSFFSNLVNAAGDDVLISIADRYLDHRVRLRNHLARKGLDAAAIATRVSRIAQYHETHARALQPPAAAPSILRQFHIASREFVVVQGDITSPALLNRTPNSASRRAIVSPDDDLLTAGAGAALSILTRAGRDALLRELAKFDSVRHTEVVVTSGGNLPVNYIFHAAATQIEADGSATAEWAHVGEAVANVIRLCTLLGVGIVYTPLIAAGSSGLPAAKSVDAILHAFAKHASASYPFPERVVICVRDRHYVRDEEWSGLIQSYATGS